MKPQVWNYSYGNNSIRIVNGDETELYVNGQLQDRLYGISFSARLTGALPTGEEIKASIGSSGIKVRCSLFVNHCLQEEE